jgi:hypothetical protein
MVVSKQTLLTRVGPTMGTPDIPGGWSGFSRGFLGLEAWWGGIVR